MMTSDRGPLESVRAFMATLLLCVLALAIVVWIVSKIWVWLVGIAVAVLLVTFAVVWLRHRGDRW
ncbi:hypothetical protein [Microbacterium paludicola]|uniref:hypothetical protein n=1 Tax=Microbacterium paludicola TaxID=300019 RepID=UPI000903E0CD|nr:hypothetical protein [Microbacterium paludicola]APF32862.1 hypothetical protein BO218_00495 [Microbacterium paludicola]